MVAARARTGVVVIRGVLLGIIVLVVASVLLFLFGRAGRPDVIAVSRDGASSTTEEAGDDDEPFAVAGEDFDFTLYQENNPVFRIRGAETRTDRYDNVFLQRVLMTVMKEDGHYELESDHATYNRSSSEAKLEGHVVVRGPNEIEVTADWLDLQEQGNILIASEGTTFRMGDDLEGTAEHIRVDLGQDTFVLSGGVDLQSTPQAERPFSLTARRVVYEKPDQRIRAEGDAAVNRGAEYLEARRISLYLDESMGEIRFLRALWNVKGRLVPPGDTGTAGQLVSFRGESLGIMFEEHTGNPISLNLEGTQREKALLRAADSTGSEQRLSSVYLSGSFRDGALESAEAIGPMSMVEILISATGERTVRTAAAQHAEARFDASGALAGATLEGGVVLKQARMEARGDRAYLNIAEGRLEFLGDPVEVETPDGRLQAPKITYSEKTGLIHAVDGVQTSLAKAGARTLAGTPLGAGDGPIRIQSDEAFLRTEDEDFAFRGKVRAWQGRNLLLADQLRGRRADKRMAASGGVRTVWYPEEQPAILRDDASDDEAEGQAESTTAHPSDVEPGVSTAPVEVTSERLSYAEDTGTLLYDGGVEVVQAGRVMSCIEMAIDLREDKQAEQMTCTGATRLVDTETSVTITADRAVYHMDQGEVDFFGSPLTVEDPVRGRIQGPRMRYRLEDGAVVMQSADAEAQPSG